MQSMENEKLSRQNIEMPKVICPECKVTSYHPKDIAEARLGPFRCQFCDKKINPKVTE